MDKIAKHPRKLTKLEMRIMEALWERGSASIREIQESFPEDDRPAYTTIQTTVYRLEFKKVVRRARREGAAHIFEPAISRDAAQRRLIDDLLAMFGGRGQSIMAHLIDSGDLTLKDLEEATKTLKRLAKKKEGPVLNHLWQSTVFAGLAWLLTLALRRNSARARYWLWLAASLKFLVPLTLLVGIGSEVSWRTGTIAPGGQVPVVMEEIAQPFGAGEAAGARPGGRTRVDVMPEVLWLVWAAGFVFVGIQWGHRWTQMSRDTRKARAMGMRLGIPVKTSAAMREPGVLGIIRPVLLLPEGIAEKLTGAQLEAILAHELCHVRRRDNLAAAMHMVVEAVFWFHPLVWWMGARMMEERERACDEEVLQMGNDAQTYAEGILKVCELYLGSPLECAAGVTGSNLNKRIEEIMTNRVRPGLSAGKRLLVGGAGLLAVAGPIAMGMMNAPQMRGQVVAKPSVAFEVVSVKPHPPGDRQLRPPQMLPGGRFTAHAPLFMVIATAYNVPWQGRLLSGGPGWIDSPEGVYDIEATAPKDAFPDGLTENQRTDRERLMLQALLADRFKLVIRRETKEMPVYALVVGKGGPKLEKADIAEKDCPLASGTNACHNFSGGRGRGLHGRAVNMDDLVLFVQNWTDRPLVNKTGIEGIYHIETQPFLPMELGTTPPPAGTKQDGVDVADVPTIYTVFERLGLRMESTKDKVDTYVIEQVERPSEN